MDIEIKNSIFEVFGWIHLFLWSIIFCTRSILI